jgi:gliding motility-associated-like protein
LKDRDEIKDFFSEKLTNHEVPVNSKIWNAVQSQIGTSVVASSTGISLATKLVVGIASSVVVTSSVVWFASQSDEKEKNPQTEITQETNPQTKNKGEEETTVVLEEAQFNSSSKEKFTNNTKTEETKVEKKNLFEAKEKTTISLKTTEIKEIKNPVIEEKLDVIAQNSQIENIIDKNNIDKKEESQTLETQNTEAVVAQNQQILKEKNTLISRLPNVISPNGDGENDYLFLEINAIVSDFQITVLNSKNEVVFTSNDSKFKWNGTDKYGNPVPVGTYGYFVILIDQDGNKVSEYVSLRVVR